MASASAKPDSELDLVLTRVIKVPRAVIWRAWTEPRHLMPWFTPVPWKTVECEIDLRPGGFFRTVMRSPEGTDHANVGCYLEIVPQEKLVWTSALGADFRPNANPWLLFTAIMTFEEQGGGTRYAARVLHKDGADSRKHADMGFADGWGKALDQLVAFADKIR